VAKKGFGMKRQLLWSGSKGSVKWPMCVNQSCPSTLSSTQQSHEEPSGESQPLRKKVGRFRGAELSGMSGKISKCSFVLLVFGNSPGPMNYSCGFSKSQWSQRYTSV